MIYVHLADRAVVPLRQVRLLDRMDGSCNFTNSQADNPLRGVVGSFGNVGGTS